MTTKNLPVIVGPGEGRTIDFISVVHRLTGDQTGDAYYCFESVFGPGEGNRLHVHSREDEFAFVISGALEVRLPDKTLVIQAGTTAHLPRQLAHALRNPQETDSHYLFMAVPAGMDRWFDALDRANEDGTLDKSTFDALALDYGIEFLE